MRAGMIGKLNLGEIGFGAVLHGPRQPHKLAEPIFLEVPTGGLWGVSVSDIEDSAIAVNLSTDREEIFVAAGQRSFNFLGNGRNRGGGNCEE